LIWVQQSWIPEFTKDAGLEKRVQSPIEDACAFAPG
jgi:hypothetical protein